jgi:hypothetical protein
MVSTSEILIAAKDKISNPKSWIKDEYSNVEDEEVQQASQFCMLGALLYTTSSVYNCKGAERLLREVIKEQYPDRLPARARTGSIPYFNDLEVTTHEDVMRVFEKAIVRSLEEV